MTTSVGQPSEHHSSPPEPITAPLVGEWMPPPAGTPAGPPSATAGTPAAPPSTTGWNGKKVIAAVVLTAALAGGGGFGIGMAVNGGSSPTQGPGGGQFPGGADGNGGVNGGPGGGFGNQQQDGTQQQGAVPNGTTSTT